MRGKYVPWFDDEAMESDLKDQTGISYSTEMRRAEQEHKGRWHGNHFTEGRKI